MTSSWRVVYFCLVLRRVVLGVHVPCLSDVITRRRENAPITGCCGVSSVATAAVLGAAGPVLGGVLADGHRLPEPGMVVYALSGALSVLPDRFVSSSFFFTFLSYVAATSMKTSVIEKRLAFRAKDAAS